jgi:PAS domain S-box-containing protein
MTDVRVLHVDDDEALLGLASVILERRGFDVVTGTDVGVALETLEETSVDCVVSDYQMPGQDGLEFLELVRERDSALPFVLFTGKGSEEVASDAIAAGVSDYLQKGTDPTQFEELADRVERVVRERRTAEGLSEGDRVLTALVETLSGAVYRLQVPDEEVDFLGGRVGELTGYDGAVFRSGEVTWRDLVHEDDVGRVEREVSEALQEGRAFNVTVSVRTADGRIRRVSNRGRGVYDGTGRPVAVEGFALDRSDGAYEAQVRELHAAARRLFTAHSVEEVARVTADAARDVLGYPVNVVRLYDEDRRDLRPAASAGPMCGSSDDHPSYPVEDEGDPLESGSYSATAFRADRPVVVTDVGEDDRPAPSEGVGAAMYLPLGGYGTLEIGATEATPFEATDREVAGILTENTGVALERVVDQEALGVERGRLAALFENVPDPAVRVEFVGGDPLVEAVNPAFEATFGYDESTVVGRSLDDLIVPPEAEIGASEYNRRARDGESLRAEVRRETADGVRDFLLRVVPQSSETGPTTGYAIYSEITERRDRDRELARQNERLEEFASVVSHDLRGPLNVAEAHLEFARTTGAAESLDAVGRAHDRMESRIDALLELARHGRAIGETSPVDLASVAERAWESVERGTAELHVEPGLPTVEADGERLGELFENLLSNAVTHGTRGPPPRSNGDTAGRGAVSQQAQTGGRTDGGKEGGPSSSRDSDGDVEVGDTADEPDELLTITVGTLGDGFYVADDGVGVPPGERERVFDPGYSTREGGTGFGLAIVRSIAEAHGWSVAATEMPDGGACFEFVGVTVLDGEDDGSAGKGSGERRPDDLT